MSHPRPATVGQLKETGYRPCTVKDELRRNVIRKLRAGEDLFPGIVGYRDSVIPQIVNGILSKHDLLFLGLRGQAKTRMLRLLPLLLDEWIPVLGGVEINDDPLQPITKLGHKLVDEQGDAAKIEWVHRSTPLCRRSEISLRCDSAPSPTSSSVLKLELETRCSSVVPSPSCHPSSGSRASAPSSFVMEAPITRFPQSNAQRP